VVIRSARICLAVSGALLLSALAPAVPAAADAGNLDLEKRRHPPVGAVGPRDFYVARPPTPAEPRRLVVFLHGCNQTAPDVAVGTRMAAAATSRGWFAVFPEQSLFAENDMSDGNGSRCWNWFVPQHQAREGGEPQSIASITRTMIDELAIDPARVYLAGISAGADMTTVLGATYPDLYAAIAPYSGCAYLTCADVAGTAAHAAMGEHARIVPALVSQGSADVVNNAAMGESALRQWLATNDLADDGVANGSVPTTPTSTEHFGLDDPAGALAPGEGDPCIGNARLPCAGGAGVEGSYPYTVSTYATADGLVAVEHWLIHGLNHAYPGGDTRGTFVDPLGPDLTNAMLDFFDRHAMVVAGQTERGSSPPSTPTEAGASGAARPDELPATGGALGSVGIAFLLAALLLRRKGTT
jgi:poly(hydroxyalkanoate) depolymerase family esterase